MKALIMLILSVFCESVWAQQNDATLLRLLITEDSIVCQAKCDSVYIQFKLLNESNSDIAIFGLAKGGPHTTELSLGEICAKASLGTGLAFTLSYANGTRRFAEVQLNGFRPGTRISRKTIDSAFNSMETDFLKSKTIMKAGSELSFTKHLPLKNFHLASGLYFLQMNYYCGENSRKTFQRNDTIQWKGSRPFQGCAISNVIPLVVK